MKTILRLGFISGVIAAFLYFLRKRGNLPIPFGPEQSGSTTFTFEPNVTRRVTVVAPNQGGHPINVEALHIEDAFREGELVAKKIKALVAPIINPRVTDTVTGQELTTFDPPLEFTVYYTAQDEEDAGGDPLFLGTYYFSKELSAWRGEALMTTASDPKARVITAQVSNLFPEDPVGLMH